MKLLVEDYLMIDIVINYISNYHKTFIVKNNFLNDVELEEICFYEGISHKDFITEIFSFLSFLINNQNDVMFDERAIDSLYTFFVDSPASKREINLFFKWLKEADDRKLVSNDCYKRIFNRMVLSEKLEFFNINIDFYNTVWNIFLSINKNLFRIYFVYSI